MVREQSEEAQWWFQAVYSAIQEIPLGNVTTYSQIAHLLGFPRRARQVGVCLKHLPKYNPAEPDKFFFHDQNVPWQRVVNAKGGISPRGDDGLGASRQARKLGEEGVEVSQARGIEELSVDLGRYGWFPKRLPSEADEEDSDESEGE